MVCIRLRVGIKMLVAVGICFVAIPLVERDLAAQTVAAPAAPRSSAKPTADENQSDTKNAPVGSVKPGGSVKREKAPAFTRVDLDGKGEPRALQTAVARYRISSGDYQGAVIDLIGAVHIGEKAYYEELNERFKGYDVVLYELVANPDDKPRKGRERRGINPVGSLQTGMKDSLKLAFQLEEIDYSPRNFVHADMSPEEFGEDMARRNDGLVSMFARIMGAGFATQGSKKNAEAQADMMAAMLSGDALKMRRAMAKQFDSMDNQMAGLADKEGKSTLLTERNAKAFEVMDRELKTGHRNIGVFYGAGHFPDMHARLLRDFNAESMGIEWLDAWDLRSGAIK